MHVGEGLTPLPSLGLAGDGDEIAAIEAVETAFGATLNYRRASEWDTAGDVFAALLDRLDHEPSAHGIASRGRSASETGVDPAPVTPGARLIRPDPPIGEALRRGAYRLLAAARGGA